ncbi:Uncharacterized protein QTN25_000774 [Entamoeba marina]
MSDKLPVLQKDHPYSRKVCRKEKDKKRDEKIRKTKKLHKSIKEEPLVEFVMWCKDQVIKCGVTLSNIRALTNEEIFYIAVEWVCRNDDQLIDINEKLSKMCHPTTTLKNKKYCVQEELKASRRQFRDGLEMPDLTDVENVKKLLTVKSLYISIKQSIQMKNFKLSMKDSMIPTEVIDVALKKFNSVA